MKGSQRKRQDINATIYTWLGCKDMSRLSSTPESWSLSQLKAAPGLPVQPPHDRRKFWSQTSEHMDIWKNGGGKSQRREEKKREDQRKERLTNMSPSPFTLSSNWFLSQIKSQKNKAQGHNNNYTTVHATVTLRYAIILHCTIQKRTIQHSTTLHSTIQKYMHYFTFNFTTLHYTTYKYKKNYITATNTITLVYTALRYTTLH